MKSVGPAATMVSRRNRVAAASTSSAATTFTASSTAVVAAAVVKAVVRFKSDEQKPYAKDLFREIDRNADGFVSKNELLAALKLNAKLASVNIYNIINCYLNSIQLNCYFVLFCLIGFRVSCSNSI